jgi:CofD-related protein of GAK system
MNTTQLVSEFLVTGSITLTLAFILLNWTTYLSTWVKEQSLIVFGVAIALSYMVGFFINVVSESLFRNFQKAIASSWMKKEGNPSVVIDQVRYEVYTHASQEVIQRLEYHRAMLRLSRSVALISLVFIIPSIVNKSTFLSVLLVSILIISIFAYYWRVIWFTKTIYYSWLSFNGINQNNLTQKTIKPNNGHQNNQGELKKTDIHVVVFAGGTGFREINMELVKHVTTISRIAPVWDNGGSSKILREHFPVIPIGDIRHALMTMAHGENRAGQVVKLFNWRLPDSGHERDLRSELTRFTNGSHPLMVDIDPSLRDVITTYLRIFENRLPEHIDLRRGSIGNFVLLGAFFAHNDNINTAIYVFRQLCPIKGNVWPVSLDTDLHICASLEDGKIIIGQEEISHIQREIDRCRIINIFFSEEGPADIQSNNIPEVRSKPNSLVLEVMKTANVIVFGPGSFFTSVLPHLLVDEIANTLSSLDVPKVLITNMLECNETYNYTAEQCVDKFLEICHRKSDTPRPNNRYLTHIIVNQPFRINLLEGLNRRYIEQGININKFTSDGITIISDNFEDPWRRGFHDPTKIADTIERIQISRIPIPNSQRA